MATPRFRYVRRWALLSAGLLLAARIPLAAQAPSSAARPRPAARPPAAKPAPEPPRPEPGRRLVVTAASAPAYSCAAVTCRVVSDLDKGTTLSVLKTEGDWHQVMVRVGATSMTTGWVKASQVSASTPDVSRHDTGATAAALPGAQVPGQDEPDPRGCLTCLASRVPSRDEWDAVMADTATRKARPDLDHPVTTGLADGRTSDEKMRDRFTDRYGAEVDRLAHDAGLVDADLGAYLSACFERHASIPVAGAAPRRTRIDDMLAAARATPGAARFAVWTGSPGFAWKSEWASQTNDTSAMPSCERRWIDATSSADRLKVDLELLERDAVEHDIYPGVVREQLATRNLAEPLQSQPTPPVVNVH
jgi:hypothetical protein